MHHQKKTMHQSQRVSYSVKRSEIPHLESELQSNIKCDQSFDACFVAVVFHFSCTLCSIRLGFPLMHAHRGEWTEMPRRICPLLEITVM